MSSFVDIQSALGKFNGTGGVKLPNWGRPKFPDHNIPGVITKVAPDYTERLAFNPAKSSLRTYGTAENRDAEVQKALRYIDNNPRISFLEYDRFYKDYPIIYDPNKIRGNSYNPQTNYIEYSNMPATQTTSNYINTVNGYGTYSPETLIQSHPYDTLRHEGTHAWTITPNTYLTRDANWLLKNTEKGAPMEEMIDASLLPEGYYTSLDTLDEADTALSALQQHLYKTTGSRIEEPEGYDRWIQNYNDSDDFELKIKDLPIDVKRFLRNRRDDGKSGNTVDGIDNYMRTVIPAYVNNNNNNNRNYYPNV